MTSRPNHAPNSSPDQKGDGEPWFEEDLRAVEKKLGYLAIPKPKPSPDISTEPQPTQEEATETSQEPED